MKSLYFIHGGGGDDEDDVDVDDLLVHHEDRDCRSLLFLVMTDVGARAYHQCTRGRTYT